MATKRKYLTPKDKLIKDLEKAFSAALEAGNYTAAIKAKELISKELDKKPHAFEKIQDLSDAELTTLIDFLETSE